jgi:peptide/nickel transport system permease protein
MMVARPRRPTHVPKTVWVALAVMVIAVGLALLGDAITPYPYTQQSLTNRLRPPAFAPGGDPSYLLGTDALGRDVLSRMIVGLRASLAAGFGGVAVASALGTLVGLLAGYFRGWLENVLMTLVDVQLALPGILLAIGVIAVLGSSGVVLVVVIGLGLWVGFARVVRSMVVHLRNEEFVVAAHSIGAREPRIIARHILPNCVTPILILATLDVPTAVVLEASLSFLGIGIQAPTPSLGNMIADGRGYLDVNPWLSVMPAIALIIVTLSVSRVGDWVSSVLDPSSSQGTVE